MNKFKSALSILCAVSFLMSLQVQAMTCAEQVLAAKEKTVGTPVDIQKFQQEKQKEMQQEKQQEKTSDLKQKGFGVGGIIMGIALVGLGALTGGVGAIILVGVGVGSAGVGGTTLYFAKAKDINGIDPQVLMQISTPALYQQSKDYLDAVKKDPKAQMGDELLAFKTGVKNKDVLNFGVAEAITLLVEKNDKNVICDGDKIATPREILDALNSDKTSLQPGS